MRVWLYIRYLFWQSIEEYESSIHLGWGLVGMWCAFLLDENIRAFIFVKRWNSLKWAKKGFVR